MARRPLLTPEAERACLDAIDAALQRREIEGATPDVIAAIVAAQDAFRDAQLETLNTWPYTYDGGEIPMVGDKLQCLDEEGGAPVFVHGLSPPMVNIGGPSLDALRAFVLTHGAELAPEMGQMIPQCCRLIRRHRLVPEG